jgi:heparan-alpha-glucosaminide N-acetyltransferase
VHEKLSNLCYNCFHCSFESGRLTSSFTDRVLSAPAGTGSEQRRDPSDPSPTAASPGRYIAVDAYRGFVMLLMMAEVLRLAEVAKSYPGNWLWSVLAYNQSHVEWAGCSLHDLIQPSFSFLVGVALPFSIASRLRRGATFKNMLAHAVWRSFVLIALGIFLRSMEGPRTYFTFEDTLTQIGLGYTFLFLLGFRSARWQWGVLAAILVGYWLAWALYPAPGQGFDWTAVRVPAGWNHNFTGFASHWNKNSNLGVALDQWFLNLFPRTSPFVANEGGYLTASFIPTLGTMILGLIAGRWLRTFAPRIPFKHFVRTGLICLAAALVLHFLGICPIVKRIWTPSWTLFSGGMCFLLLAAFSWIIELKGYRKWAFPLVVIGTNSIAAYLIAHLFENFIVSSFRIHLGERPFQVFGPAAAPVVLGAAVLLVYWWLLFWMYRNKIFLKV